MRVHDVDGGDVCHLLHLPEGVLSCASHLTLQTTGRDLAREPTKADDVEKEATAASGEKTNIYIEKKSRSPRSTLKSARVDQLTVLARQLVVELDLAFLSP